MCKQLVCDDHGTSYFSGLGTKESMFYKPESSLTATQEKNIGALLKEACADWNILDKNPALVTDNARNMIVAGLEAEMRPYLACFVHTINLASQKALKVDTAAKLLGKVRRVVGFLHRNIRGAEILREKQQQLSLPAHKLI